MKTTDAVKPEDETRDQIDAKIDVKSSANEKLETRKRNLTQQVSVYRNSLTNYEEKIKAAKARLEMFEASLKSTDVDIDRRGAELEHMKEIRDRYVTAQEEITALRAFLLKKIEDAPDWMPGMPDEMKDVLKNDKEYQTALNRKLYLDDLLDEALTDVRKIYSSRGEVSAFHAKGRADV